MSIFGWHLADCEREGERERRLGFLNKLFLINERWEATAATVQIHTSIEKLKANRRHWWTLARICWTQKFLITSKAISVYRSERANAPARHCVWQVATLHGFASTSVFLFRIAFVLLCFCTRWNISERASNLFRCLISDDCRQISQSAASSICKLREKQRTHTHREGEKENFPASCTRHATSVMYELTSARCDVSFAITQFAFKHNNKFAINI